MSALNDSPFETPTAGRYYMPLLSVRLRGPAGLFPMRLLVDSGAYETVLPETVLRQIGVEITTETVHVEGVDGSPLVGRVAQVRIEVPACNDHFVSRVLATHDGVLPVLGHRDFFASYWVGFNTSTRQFYVSRPRAR